MKKGFVFDLDGVITDTATYHYNAWKTLAFSIGIVIDQTFNEQLKGISRMDSLERILIHGGKENDYSNTEKEKLAEQKNNAYFDSLQNLSSEDILPGAREFLKSANENNVPCALASASRNAPFIIDRLGIKDVFDGIVDSHSLKKNKPDPEIFIKGAETIGICPGDGVGFEDAQAGIEAIKRAGMYAVGIETTSNLHGADIIVTRLDQLSVPELLQK